MSLTQTDQIHPLYRWSLLLYRLCEPIKKKRHFAIEAAALRAEPILSCPFCGSTDCNDRETDYQDSYYWQVECYNCGCRSAEGGDKLKARKSWNHRWQRDKTKRRGIIIVEVFGNGEEIVDLFAWTDKKIVGGKAVYIVTFGEDGKSDSPAVGRTLYHDSSKETKAELAARMLQEFIKFQNNPEGEEAMSDETSGMTPEMIERALDS